jgi:beta-glucanase (GH16 family)
MGPIKGRRSLKRAISALMALTGVVVVLVAGVSGPGLQIRPAKAFTWTLQWSDEFSGSANTGVDTTQWIYDTGNSYPGGPSNWGTGEVESYTTSTDNVYQDGNGHLVIQPIHQGKGAPTMGWTSGRIETQRLDFAAPAGGAMAIEASIQQPNVSGKAAQGYWPAFWVLGDAYRGNYLNWPGVGEIDILEDRDGQSVLYGTLHCGVGSGGPCNETTGLTSGPYACFGCQMGFHTYRMEYDRTVSPEQVRWYLDGVQYHSVSESQVDATTWSNALHHGFFILLNVAMGGGFPGNPTKFTASGVPMVVDYVRVYYGL